MKLVTDSGIVFFREVRPELRGPWGLAFGMAQPVVFLALFGPLLSGMPGVGDGPPWQWFVPGVLLLQGLFGTFGAGYFLLIEGDSGSLERMLVTPLSRVAMLIGRTMKEIVTLLVQSVLIIALVLPFGFELHVLGVLAGLVMLVVLGVGLGSLSFALALKTRRHPDVFYMVQQTALFPLIMLSGVLLPMTNAPGWLAVAASVNPLTYVVEAERALFAGDFSAGTVLWGALAAAVVAAAGLVLGTRGMRRASM